MSTSAGWRTRATGSSAGAEAVGAPGKQTMTELLPVQRRATGPASEEPPAGTAGSLGHESLAAPFSLHVQKKSGDDVSAAKVQQAAGAGIRDSGGALPFADQIQASFGAHSVQHVQAHVGGAAAGACEAMGAEAYATGHHVAFAGPPDLHTAAHEAAHVVQQRSLVQLLGGVGQVGDVYEQHADQVADLVVQGKSAQSLLDRVASPGATTSASQGGPVQRKLIVGKKEIPAEEVEVHLTNALSLGQISEEELGASKRLVGEAADAKETYSYPSWQDAAVGVREHDLSQAPSVAIQRGSIVFTNAAKKFHSQATQLLEMLGAHPSISKYLDNRPCFISLVRSPDNPASVIDLGKQINIELAYWYFETYPIGYQLGMLCHEFAVHPMADLDLRVQAIEPDQMGKELDSGIMDGKKPHTVNTDRAGQVDHIFAAIVGMPRNSVYLKAVLEMASLLAQEANKLGSDVGPEEVTNLLDCFMMDCASILATNDHRDKGAFVPGLIATAYNDYLAMIQHSTSDKEILAQLPPPKTKWGVAKAYFGLVGNLASGSMKNASRDHDHYQPTDVQAQYLETHHRRLHWIEPDGRCVFGALGRVAGLSTHVAISTVLMRLNAGHAGLTLLITNAGQNVEEVIECIRKGRWADPAVGDIILEVAATALGIGVTVLLPNGQTYDICGGGELIVRVTSPLEHYHGVSR